MSPSKWTTEEENLLTEMVENYVNKKKSKKEAFDVVANILNRSSSACRARYIKIEKSHVKGSINEIEAKQLPLPSTNQAQNITLEDIISFLKTYKLLDHYEEKNYKLRSFLKSLEKENEELKVRYHSAKNKMNYIREFFLKTSTITHTIGKQ
jgi:RsfA family transcription factor